MKKTDCLTTIKPVKNIGSGQSGSKIEQEIKFLKDLQIRKNLKIYVIPIILKRYIYSYKAQWSENV